MKWHGFASYLENRAARETRLASQLECIYNSRVRFTWNEAKRQANVHRHGLDFVDAREVFAGPTVTFDDDRFDYGEQRYVSLGLLRGFIVSIVHTETEHEIHIISFRKATRREGRIFLENL